MSNEDIDLSKMTVVGLTEKITLLGTNETREVIARIDTGATKSSIDLTVGSKIGVGPILDSKLIKSAHGVKLRPVIQATFIIKNKNIKAKFTLADRSHMKYPVLIGQNVLREGFLVDPSKRADPKTD